MIHEYRTYTALPGALDRFLDLFARVALPIRASYKGKLVGIWTEQDGDPSAVHHLWSYESLDARAADRAALGADPAWQQTFVGPISGLLKTQRNAFLHLRHGDPSTLAGPSVQMTWLLCRPFVAAAVLQEVARQLPDGAAWTCEAPDPNRLLALHATSSTVAPGARPPDEADGGAPWVLETRSIALSAVPLTRED